jgi:hypothetical protein
MQSFAMCPIPISMKFTKSNEFVQRNNVSVMYDNIFYFNFTQSKVEILK